MILLTSLLCGTKAAAISTVPSVTTCSNFGKLNKIWIQRTHDGATRNSMTLADSKLLATYTALQVAVDNTKGQITPKIQSPSTTAGSERTARGGNDSQGGVEIILGTEPTVIDAQILMARQDVIAALQDIADETTGLGVIMFNDSGWIMAEVDDVATPTTVYPIPVENINFGDLVPGNYDDVDYNPVKLSLPGRWSRNVAVITDPSFNAITDLS